MFTRHAFKSKIYLILALAVVILLMMNLPVTFQIVQAAAETKEYVQLNAGITLADNMVALKGRTVTVTLLSGQAVTGIVKDVKNTLLHLEKISQKEFYDAIIRIDHISAIESRVR